MSRLDSILRVLILVTATFLLTEWVHYRLGTPPLFQYLLGNKGSLEAARGHDPDAVTESEFQTYLRVLEAMQVNRSMSIDDAVEAEHLPLAKFREQYKGEGYTSVEGLCASSNIDAVYIATPNSLHDEHAITAAKNKKHIIIEKPMAMNLA